MILSAAINAQTANKVTNHLSHIHLQHPDRKEPASKLLHRLAELEERPQPIATPLRQHRDDTSKQKVSQETARICDYPSAKHIVNEVHRSDVLDRDHSTESEAALTKEKKENYIKNVEVKDDTMILHHSKLDTCT